ncbi:Uncharacterised protein [Mycobacteroides abscessus]|uniref:hypothetical protein n=1 Tax=Mycobacteroides abscessus TaxID=36809 RepID=UPI00036A0A32|nr:hypothetical protein [Mycobacteroides abscessus]CPT64626.1 Uncharacterised protein [Mycobacteroides abscessus]CPU57003.1 Uncharacterised protein [Mycobacteroides abscessus]SKJ84214.1 Uncharacterised protein [Mycobacteroides abscessus subsp. massiliense]SKQ05595.1 Uncharacterised protein [Mycobacteroides abscessus subsp. massiliense]SKV52893.1 Uncharacterised protein [Mycobacteroides abscessus subsp. massiliense]
MASYETSRVFPQVLSSARDARVNARVIATELELPVAEVHVLTFGAELRMAQDTDAARYIPAEPGTVAESPRAHLQLV